VDETPPDYVVLRNLLTLFAWFCFICAGGALVAGFMGAFDTVRIDPLLRSPWPAARPYFGFIYAVGCVGTGLIFLALGAVLRLLVYGRVEKKVRLLTDAPTPAP
jgi:hypothetical protein